MIKDYPEVIFIQEKSKRMSYGFRRGGKSEGVIGNSRKPVSIMPFFVST
jgi:hypothetical protein